MTARRILSLILNLAIAGAALAAWLRMVLRFDENGVLTASGFRSLKYFTVLSNLLQAGASLAYAMAVLTTGGAPLGVRMVKYAATASVMLTFLVVVAFLGPVFGYKGMYEGGNLWLHLVVPLAAAADFMLLDRSGPIPFGASFAALVPMLMYAVFYVGNILARGIRTEHGTNDWYGFLGRGWGGGAVAALAVTLATWGLALLLRWPRQGT